MVRMLWLPAYKYRDVSILTFHKKPCFDKDCWCDGESFPILYVQERDKSQQQIIIKLLEFTEPWILQLVNESVFKKCHQFVFKTEKLECTKWLLRPN